MVERKSDNISRAELSRKAYGLVFAGFERPTYTAIPNELYDVLMSLLSPAELKVVLYVARRTFGFKRGSDRISASQFERGIVRHDGRVLDHGTGLSRRAVYLALDSLTSKGILLRQRHSSDARGDEANEYALNIAGLDPWAAGEPICIGPRTFTGVKAPAYTLTPDEIFDSLLYVLSSAELKVLLYVTRRTFGFNKLNDRISLSQFAHGIIRRDGSTLDSGTGLTRRTIQLALDSMVEKHVLLRRRYRNENGDEPSEYALNIIDVDPWNSEGSAAFRYVSSTSATRKHSLPGASYSEPPVRSAVQSVFNADGSVMDALGGAMKAMPGAPITPGGRYLFTPGVDPKTLGGVQNLDNPECNEDAHNIQKNKIQLNKTLSTIEKSQFRALKRLQIEALVAEILEVTGDRSSRNFYFKIAWRLPEDLIRTAIRDTRDERATSRIKKSAGAFFTDWLKRLAESRGIDMP